MKALEFIDGCVRYLDQTKLPHEESFVSISDERELIDALKSLSIRGAPLIGIAGAYGVVLAARRFATLSPNSFHSNLKDSIEAIRSARPTAVNLSWAIDRMDKLRQSNQTISQTQLCEKLLNEVRSIHIQDEEMCSRIGSFGATLIPTQARVLTHCNAGALATGGIGTALGVITTAARQGKVERVFVNETRPLLQGSRLTMWELMHANIPATLITDSTGPSLMRNGLIDAIVVGADRIAANGGFANKIGTYMLAIAASAHKIPFYVAAPSSTIDFSIPTEDHIPIEMRDQSEVIEFHGMAVAPAGSEAYAPAFDVTPPELVTAIISERGIHRPPFGATLALIGERRVEEEGK